MLSTLIAIGFLQNQLFKVYLPQVEQKVSIQVNFESSSPISNEQKALQLVKKYASEYNVSAYDMERVLRCENNTFDPTLQSFHKKKDGTRERSYGVAQWNLDFNDITYEQATDMEWSIKEMARMFSLGRQSMWSCWHIVNTPSQGD